MLTVWRDEPIDWLSLDTLREWLIQLDEETRIVRGEIDRQLIEDSKE